MKPLQSAYWAVGCWLVLTLVAYGLDPLFRSGRHNSMEKRYVDQIVQDFEIQKTESYAALTRQQLIDRWLPLANNYELVPASLTPVTIVPPPEVQRFWIVEWKVDCDPDWVLSVNLELWAGLLIPEMAGAAFSWRTTPDL